MDKILCLSGGIDSTCAYYLLGKPKTVFFDTGGYSALEKDAVLHFAPDTIIDKTLDFRSISVDSSAYIPYRNLLIAARAASYLPNGGEVILAGLKDDLVSDKNPKAFIAMQTCLRELDGKFVSVNSPFWNSTKADVIRQLKRELPDSAREILLNTFSCYAPVNGKECLSCPACFRKWNALWENEITTRFKNKDLMDKYYQDAMDNKYVEERCESIIKSVDSYFTWDSVTDSFAYCFDIDGVLTNETEGHDYENRTPKEGMIDQLNKLFFKGNWIILHTARWKEDQQKTISWLRKHGVNYHRIQFDKPKADFYIDDKMLAFGEVGNHV